MADWNEMNAAIIEEFRANGGAVGGDFEGAPLLLLHTTGTRSGKERINPLMYQRLGDRLAVFASRAGMATHPDWYRNVVATPEVTVEVGASTRPYRARTALDDERERIWETQKERYPTLARYESSTERQIPVVVLEPVD